MLVEIQRIPSLLPEIHRLIETKRYRFLLTGSSARKLRRGSADLLGGRAWVANLFPLTSAEIPSFDVRRYLRFGGLPTVYLSESPGEDLRAYVSLYLQEEIRAEGIIRQLPPFTRFLRVAALSSGQLLKYAQVASDAEVAVSTVREYFSVLEDTLVGWTLEPWRESRKRKAIQTAKFHFFDVGSCTSWPARPRSIGIRTSTAGASSTSSAWRCERIWATPAPATAFPSGSTHGYEVDFLIGGRIAIEVKSTRKASLREARRLLALREEKVAKRFLLVSEDQIAAKRDGIEFLQWSTFLRRLWDGEIV